MSSATSKKAGQERKRSGILRGITRSRDGVAAIEFAILAIPFFLIVFAIIETFVAYAGEQLLANAVDVMSRKLRTGQITYNRGLSTDMSEAQFRTAFCDQISIMLSCSNSLVLDVRHFSSFADMPIGVPMKNGALDTTGFDYDPGGPSTDNMVRAYYHWPIVTDLVRPYISNERPTSSDSDYLMVATTAFVNEDYL